MPSMNYILCPTLQFQLTLNCTFLIHPVMTLSTNNRITLSSYYVHLNNC